VLHTSTDPLLVSLENTRPARQNKLWNTEEAIQCTWPFTSWSRICIIWQINLKALEKFICLLITACVNWILVRSVS